MNNNDTKKQSARGNCAKPQSTTRSATTVSDHEALMLAAEKGGEAQSYGLTIARDLADARYGPGAVPDVLIERAAEAVMAKTSTNDEAQFRTAVGQRVDAIIFEYERLFERVFQAAKQTFPLEYAGNRLDEDMVVYFLDEVVTRYFELVYPVQPVLDLDTFTDVVWPATKLRLAAALETTVSIDASRLESWYRNHNPAAAQPE